jgi:hypothetical protein
MSMAKKLFTTVKTLRQINSTLQLERARREVGDGWREQAGRLGRG